MTFQFSIWDKFRDLENLPATNFANLVHLVAHLLKTKSLPLSLLKVCVMYGLIQGTNAERIQLSLEPRGVRAQTPWEVRKPSDFTVTSKFWFHVSGVTPLGSVWSCSAF